MTKVDIMKPSVVKEDDSINKKAKLELCLTGKDYDSEEKYDGCRYKTAHGYFFSSDNVEKTNNFPHLRDFFRSLNMPNLILDGEIYYPGKTSQYCTQVTGSSSGNAVAVQNKIGMIHYVIYDIIRTPNGTIMTQQPYSFRRNILEQFYGTFIKGTSMEAYIHLSRKPAKGQTNKEFLDEILSADGEGIVLKKKDSLYVMGKKPMWQWIKIKQKDTTDFIITGFEQPTVIYTGEGVENWPYWKNINGVFQPVTKNYYNGWVNSIEFSAYVDGVLTKICTASGLKEEVKIDIKENPDKYLNHVARVGFMEKTEAGYPRHPKFVSLHETKQPQECTWTLNK